MTNERIQRILDRLNGDRTIQNFIAQANARYILLNTAEDRNAFPQYTIDDDRLNMLALQYLNLGCCWAENQRLTDAVAPLERGAAILEMVHGAAANQKPVSNYYGLIGAMAYYVSFQYSKSFIFIGKIESTTNVARCIGLFLLRDFRGLNELIYSILFNATYSDEAIIENFEKEGNLRVYDVVIARALDGYVKYLQTGDQNLLEAARSQLTALKDIANMENDPGIWWVIRLLLLISQGFSDAAVWNVLSGYFSVDEQQVDAYIRSLVYMQPRGIYELFITQRNSLAKVLNEDAPGCVVSIPTSAGKTRIAELAILHTIQKDPGSKILYIAPFRSLAFEVENSMEQVFEHSGIGVSHLYGGSTYSKLDEMAIEESSLIIATPEKAKAILRGNNELIGQIKLAIIDEGHLLGDDKRLVVNEMFYEELRYYVNNNDGRFLVLSAVLPNAEELAKWLTGEEDTVYRENWRPSDERIGILEWNGGRAGQTDGAVNLKWESQDTERPSFNNNFIRQEALPLRARQRVVRYFPASFNDAVAATARRLHNFGPVLIYAGRKSSVFTIARSYLNALGEDPADHSWKQRNDWRAYELACSETYGDDNEWLDLARKGILCHNADLHADVRLPLERLMRADKPLVIISTSTLGQGVNLGVSTVIFSSLRQGRGELNARDFWNIAGRAGRAFVDHEGKVLVAHDVTGKSRSDRDYEVKNIRYYFNKDKIGVAKSGIMLVIKALKQEARLNEVNFALLLELIAENRLDEIGGDTEEIEAKLDWIDDTLLSLLLSHNPEGAIDVSWAEDFFSKSLAAIQSAREANISGEQVVRFLESRISSIAERVGDDRNKWRSIVKSGIPLNSDLLIEERMPDLLEATRAYLDEDRSVENRIGLLTDLEALINDLPVLIEDDNYFDGEDIDQIRELWLKGAPNTQIFALEQGNATVTKLYAFSLPWVLNGIAKKMRNLECEEEATLVEELAILVEAGLPTILNVKIYQAGIRSRFYACEIGEIFNRDDENRSISSLRKELVNDADAFKLLVSETAGEWLDLLSRNAQRRHTRVKRISFTYGEVHKKTRTLIARTINGQQYLLSPDLSYTAQDTGDVDFSSVNNIPGIEFRYSNVHKEWRMYNDNPYIEIEN
jgi:hypothetical protein